MKKFIFAICLLFAFSTQAQQIEEIAVSPTTYAVCRTADILSTYYLLQHGFVEANPIVQASLAYGWLPLIISGIVVWYILDKYKNDDATLALNIVTCGVAMRNILLIP
jgi:hypothetical protein